DRHHDQSVNDQLFPAMARGDQVAAHKALLLADRYVRIPLKAQEQIAGYVSRRQAEDVATAKADAASARKAGILAGVLATLLAIGIAALVSRGIRRSAKTVLDRLSALEANDAAALQAALDAVAGGDLTTSVHADTPAIEKPGEDELGDIARATNGI